VPVPAAPGRRLHRPAAARRGAAPRPRPHVRATGPHPGGRGGVLGLPFSTYRRHLAAAVDDLVDLLWAVEIGEVVLLDEAGPPVSSD
jgi:hypothetical protein